MTPPVESSTAEENSIRQREKSQSETTFYDGWLAAYYRRLGIGPDLASEFADTLESVRKLGDWALPTLIENPHSRVALYWHKTGVPPLESLSALSSPESPQPGSHWEVNHLVPILVDAESGVSNSTATIAEATTKLDDGVSDLREHLLDTFNELFDQAKDEVFHDGMESDFRLSVGHAIRACGDVAVHALHTVIRNNLANIEVVEEALRRIGSVDDIRTYHSRLGVLLQELESANPRIRDAASIGIAEMDDPIAIGNVSRAIDNETSEQLRSNLGSVLSQLQATRCHAS